MSRVDVGQVTNMNDIEALEERVTSVENNLDSEIDKREEQITELKNDLDEISDPSPNLLQLNAGEYTRGYGGATIVTTENNHVSFNGTSASGTGANNRLSDVFTLPAGTYTLSLTYDNSASASYVTRMIPYLKKTDNTEITHVGSSGVSTFTLDTDTDVYYSVKTSANSTYNNYGYSVMLNEGDTALPFNPPSLTANDKVARENIESLQDRIPVIGRRIINRNYNIAYANAVNPIRLTNVYGTIENVHPKVLYFANKLFGHKYWMAYTPYTNENTSQENPCIAFSDDGINWTNIENNPLDTGETSAYFSDTHLVYNTTTGLLECWYRLSVDTDPANEYIYRQVSSDGLVWSGKELLKTGESGAKARLLSPAVIYENNVYKIWVVTNKDGYHIEYYETANAADWGTAVRTITLEYTHDGISYRPWHIDAQYIDGQYIILVMCKGSAEFSNAPWALFVTTSQDNIIYSNPIVIMEPNIGAWDSDLYRSCLVKDDNYKIYYSARNGRTQGMSISVADNLYKFIGYDLLM